MKFRPLFDRVVVLPEKEENISASGIVLPQTAQEKPQQGKVVAVGTGEDLDYTKCTIKVKVGEKVVFNKYAGVELKLDGKNYIILRQIDVIGVIDD
ncbi:MAG: co-chaperone GroES [Clostridia bacterium]|nr:co-chaperone GroES [Clostridia bacterium]